MKVNTQVPEVVNERVPTFDGDDIILEEEINGEISGLAGRVQNLGVTSTPNQTMTDLPGGFQRVSSSNTPQSHSNTPVSQNTPTTTKFDHPRNRHYSF